MLRGERFTPVGERVGRMRAIAFLMILLTLPTADASWSAFGDAEPSTQYDLPFFAWQEAPGDELDRIYFNAIANIGVARTALVVSPNVGLLETAIEPVGAVTHTAILGVWVDCNGDGYVGLAETAAREYSARLLLGDRSRCPFRNGPADEWAQSGRPHNYNDWVTELIPIVPAKSADDDRVIVDPAARVWGDYGRPGDPPSATQDPLVPELTSPRPKTAATWNFVSMPAHRGAPPGSLLGGGRSGPEEFAGLAGGAYWTSDSVLVKPAPNTRESQWSTFYASLDEEHTVGVSGYEIPGTSAPYGVDACMGARSGVLNGWDCDRDRWYRAWDGTPIHEPRPFARPGDRYQLRDVDCHDGHLGNLGVAVAPAFYQGNGCYAG